MLTIVSPIVSSILFCSVLLKRASPQLSVQIDGHINQNDSDTDI